MGLADIFSSSANNPPPVPPKNAMGVNRDKEKDEIIRRLTEELMRTRERNQQLEKDLPALAASKAAVERARELEDVVRLKDIMVESLERQVSLLEKYNAALQQKEAELVALRAEQVEQPISQPDLLHRYEQLCDIFGQLRDTLTCPVCYEPFDKDQAVSLLCGHSFCGACYAEWERKHIEAFKMSSIQGQYTGPECPECRTADVRRGRVRIWSLEEVVRLVDRANREIADNPHTPAVPPIEPLTAADLLLADESATEAGDAPFTSVGEDARKVDNSISFGAETAEGAGEKEQAQTQTEADQPAMDVDLPSPPPSDAPDSPTPSTPAQPASSSNSARTPSPPPAPPTTSTFPSRLSSSDHHHLLSYLRAQALARAQQRASQAHLEAESARLRAEEEEREAREAREEVLSERRRMPYEAVFR
ncbi:hypothetical protein NBRC10512_005161 [Rhodotorula toruloides]|uniref:RHTO0S02e13762g1_1 n=2 Tax=Rhodotorula toruloides TaxID=5286 RepID=A0A061APQ2_RHOTO|nr:zinc finger, RING-type protein [Rhodotorula toruloides NP11]EMS23435.1 zinc finger, RING-type protein [Rhodotorula toruloides NP11]CDR37348.1 RHTO0S02e13762g1_1 [Rhodotorula toruloides]